MDMDDITSIYFSGSSSDTNLYNCQTKDFLTRNVINVLVVDDDATSLSLAAAILTRWKYRATKARHAIDALCTLRMKDGIKFDLVITDVRMPDMDGFELQNQIRKEFVNLPVVFMSGDQTEATVTKGLTSGALGFLKKPMGAEDMRDLWQYVHKLRKDDKKESEKVAVPENNSNSNGGGTGQTKKALKRPELNNSKSNGGTGQSKKDLKRPENNRNSNGGTGQNKKDSKKKPENNRNSNGGTCQNKKDSKKPATTRSDNVELKKEKRAKLVWTTHLHYRFLEALRILEKGRRCVPKNILEYMNVPGLTRDHIASHLQKYRLFLNRVKDDKSSKYQSSRLADQNLQYSSPQPGNPTSAQTLPPSLYERTGGHNNFPVLNSLNHTNVSNPNQASPMTDPIPPSGYGQSRLLTHPAISRGPMTGTGSSMTMYQSPKQAPPNLLNNGPSTFGTPTLGIGGCGGSTVPAYGTIGASSSSGPVQNLSHFNTNYNCYQTPAEHNFAGNERQVDRASGSMNKPTSIFDLVFSRKPGDPSTDPSSIILNGINKQSSTNNQQENPNLGSTSMGSNHAGDPLLMINGQYSTDIKNGPAEPNLGAGTTMGASHVEDLLMMNGQHSNDMVRMLNDMQIEGEDVAYSIFDNDGIDLNEDVAYSIFGNDGIDLDEDVAYSIFGNDEVDLDEFFSWFDQNPNQMDIGETSMLNHSNPSASHPTPAGVIDDEDFLASLLVDEEPYGMDVDNFGE